MKAEQLQINDWFKREGDWRVHTRLPGDPEIIEEQMAVPVQPIQPTLRQRGFYIPSSEKVTQYKEVIIRLS